MPFVSFAQNYEDVMLWRALGHVGAGFYIDVGAFSPEADSVTHAFYVRGWRGVNIEPIPRRLAELAARRDRDVNLGVVASDRDGTARLHIVGDTGLSTVDVTIAERHRTKGWAVSAIDVPQRTLTGLLDTHLAPGQPIHFLKIDVEGHETAVVRGLDLTRYRPWVILIEATHPNSPEETARSWETFLTAAGYRSIYWDGLNRFYLAAEHEELAPAFSAPPNVFDNFVKGDGEAHAQLREQVQGLEGLLAAERARTGHLATRVQQQGQTIEALNTALARQTEATAAALEYAARRSLWEALFFRPSGRPKKMVRQLLFHTSGKPRKAFRRLVFHTSGRPRRPFRLWLHSAEYQALRGAVVMEAAAGVTLQPHEPSQHPSSLSPAAAHLARRIAARRTRHNA
ncbi:FkbM family methyltransferase [Ancylobacter sp.]|uniref:FkbM family methyltransferase n=1 Tax=Ancylobacter sp. TaxID=1872567 RepID=UPI003C7CFBF8